jgi:cell division protein FtsB
MYQPHSRPAFGLALVLMVAVTVGGYFTFAAVLGDHGKFRRIELNAQIAELTATRDTLQSELARMENLTRRLSDTNLDLDLLDERARDMLGYLRADEVVLH